MNKQIHKVMWALMGHRKASNQNQSGGHFHDPIKLKFYQIPSEEELDIT